MNNVPQTATSKTPVTANGAAAAPIVPDHVIQLPGSDWKLWRWSALRATGFPANSVLTISSAACSQAVERLHEAEAEAELRRQGALAAAIEAYAPVRYSEKTGDRKSLAKALRSLNKGKPTPPGRFDGAVEAALEAYRTACIQRDLHDAAFRETFKQSLPKMAQALCEVASNSRFQEAVIWQNHRVFNRAVAQVRDRAPNASLDWKHRQRLELIANYLQRYCLKNETIGFFGPVGWARLNPEGETIDVRPGENLLAERTVYFESWCINELVEFLNKEKALRPWIAPRQVPYLHLDGLTLYLPQSRPMQLLHPQALALKLCDGQRTAKSIVAALKLRFPAEIKNEAAGHQLFEFLESRGFITWKLELAPGVYPDRALRKLLESVEDETLRERALKPLVELEAGRDQVVRASGDPEKLHKALHELDATFERITATASTRQAGKMNAARTIVYEDCRRDLQVAVGPELLEHLSGPLSLLLASARWFTFEVAQYYRRIFKEVFEQLAREANSRHVNGAVFWYRCHEYFLNSGKTGSNDLLSEFQKRWAEVLSLDANQKCVNLTSEQLRPLIEKAFAAPRPGWSSARYHSPDVMVAAASAEAIRRGDYELVLGEVHLGINTLRGALFTLQHPNPPEMFRAVQRDMPERGIIIGPPKDWVGLTSRSTAVLIPAESYWLLVAHDSLVEPGKHILRIGSLVIEQIGGDLIVRTRDGRLRFDIIEAFADMLSSLISSKFKIIEPAPHTPRVTLDRMVISRERWMFTVSDLPFTHEKVDSQRFLEVRRWAKSVHGLPRFVFVKSPVEVKPCYVDFDSPIYVDLF